MKTDIEIAQTAQKKPITEIANRIGISANEFENYGPDKAKISLEVLQRLKQRADGRLILVTAISPTKAGEGKSTVTIGLGDALCRAKKNALICLREPSMGPVFGLKGGATGGGYAQVVPMEDINLHFTGDMHAIAAANNLISACIDNHLYWGNELGIDKSRIVFKRSLDMNDRALRILEVGRGTRKDTNTHLDGFNITAASEVMAVLCLASDLDDLKARLNRIVVAYTKASQPVTVADLKISGALSVILKDAIKPNLVQTLENNPALIHGGPFANIAHGCNSVLATKIALKLGDYVVTEAGFGADLGAEKFLDLKCRFAELNPDCSVLVATIRALKLHGGAPAEQLADEDLLALEKGLCNLKRHLETLRSFGLPVIVALNRFSTDTEGELELVQNYCQSLSVPCSLVEVFEKGSAGAADLVQQIMKIFDGANQKPQLKLAYQLEDSLLDKLTKVAKRCYGAQGVHLEPLAQQQLEHLTQIGLEGLPICIAKTPNSFSDDPTLLGAPEDFTISVRELRLSAGAGFIVCLTGNIMTMPGLPRVPAAQKIDWDGQQITGLS